MTAAKAGTYVLSASAFYRVEGEGDEAVRRRYKRGDRVKLSKAEANRHAVPTPIAPAAFVLASEADDDDAAVLPGDELVTSPPAPAPHPSQADGIIAAANTGLLPATEAGLTEEQVDSNAAVAQFPPVTGAVPVMPGSADDLARQEASAAAVTGADGKPAKSATTEVWRDYAVSVDAVSADEASTLTKAALQEAVARKVG